MHGHRFIQLLIAIALPLSLRAQSAFDLQNYKQFLETHRQLSASGIMQLHPAGTFAGSVPAFTGGPPEHLDLINSRYQLTAHEDSLLVRNGFVVTERIRRINFVQAYLSLWLQDLPVFISSDALLHAVHRSYDAILRDVEEQCLSGTLDELLASMHDRLPAAVSRYGNVPGMNPSLLDVDLYLTVARRLLGRTIQPVFLSQVPAVDSLLAAVAAAQVRRWSLFSTTQRTVDFSQFTPRGHYTQSEGLTRYFQAMIWLGRTELYLIPPRSDDPVPTDEEIQRQTIDAMLVAELATSSNPLPSTIERTIRTFVGEQDNITLDQLSAMAVEAGISSAADLVNPTAWRNFQSIVLSKPFAFQRIHSQILMSDPANPDSLRPACAFLLFGQRFIVDSYVFSNVVYDRVRSTPLRMIPSPLDVLAALGNDAALQLLQPELEKYGYAPNLAALRYLVDSYDRAFWGSSLYNGWLNAIKSLNPPPDRSGLPAFMRTAAWWQHAMNTQLASWAELRHDNLLYAKQSYTGGVVCAYPDAYLEPVPDLYRAIKTYADSARVALASLYPGMARAIKYFSSLSSVADTLAGIAVRELGGEAPEEAERVFLRSVVYRSSSMCGTPLDGWYPRIHYDGDAATYQEDMVVADVHTVPTDASGSWVGWVLHAGTGPVNMAIIQVRLPDGRRVALAGPVMSYYEHMTSGFKRLTDKEWRTMYAQPPSARPSLVNIFLADASGGSRGSGPMLLTGIEVPGDEPAVPLHIDLSQGYPNPFNGETTLRIEIPPGIGPVNAELFVVSVHGQCVRRLFAGPLGSGSYSVRWDGRNDQGRETASGVYMAMLRSGDGVLVRKLVLIR